VIGQRFTVAKRRVAMLCVALCMALSTQVTIVLMDQLKHAFNVEHAPNALAGAVVFHDHDVAPHSHPHGDDGGPAHGHHSHSHDSVPDNDHDSLAHHHYGNGILAPWLVSPTFVFASAPLPAADYEFVVTKHPDAPIWRRDRPPKLDLERIA
jgi:hypothetical protein